MTAERNKVKAAANVSQFLELKHWDATQKLPRCVFKCAFLNYFFFYLATETLKTIEVVCSGSVQAGQIGFFIEKINHFCPLLHSFKRSSKVASLMDSATLMQNWKENRE